MRSSKKLTLHSWKNLLQAQVLQQNLGPETPDPELIHFQIYTGIGVDNMDNLLRLWFTPLTSFFSIATTTEPCQADRKNLIWNK